MKSTMKVLWSLPFKAMVLYFRSFKYTLKNLDALLNNETKNAVQFKA